MKIEILYFDGCPNHEPTLALVQEIVSDLAIDAEITATEVRDDSAAQRLRFLGSPTVRVDGLDIEPEASRRTDYAMSCRMYGISGIPSPELIKAALRRKGTS